MTDAPQPPRTQAGAASERKQLKAEVIRLLSENLDPINTVCRRVGIPARRFRDWRRKDAAFRKELEDARVAKIDAGGDTLFARGMNGDTRALIHWLRCKDPDNWEPNRNLKVESEEHHVYDWDEIRRQTKKIYAELERRQIDVPAKLLPEPEGGPDDGQEV